ERMGAHPILRSGPSKDGPVVTDNGFWIIDAEFGKIKNPDELAERLNQIPGVLEHGIFTNVDTVIVGKEGDTLIL
ncbi:MAG: ribose-5-phosphate isomerase A, partial [Methermicoccaceae archaeon]